ncbi:MAG TPA: helix-turn-helix transcriptional regulator [Amycolatopsis sp.]|uniref:Helix-turn-helix transcriptional regulator n=1 Tax=Amycolatopsis nalaikhensis TaxID=715472 RepID=A0ABY8XPZ9_9PSEU|nr:helix-turn-helix transcriptional regulator [Amycolatopsis sp. 2-2]WIV57703.1 helix-turn-helix transcriptional regulator [Amycolatopsis sp. 2-2]
MARPPSPSPDDSASRRQLGLKVRALRKRAGLTQERLAEQVKYHQTVISRLEQGYKLSPGVLEQVLPCLGATTAEQAELRSLNDANEPGRAKRDHELLKAGAPWFRPVLEREPAATRILSWTGERLKGLLQAESYMIAQFSEHDVHDIADAVADRAGRTVRAFTENPGCRYEFLISESAIERVVQCVTVNQYVAVDQLKHLLDLVDRNPNIDLRVVPYANRLHVSPDFTIMEFAEPEPTFGYSDLLRTLVTTDEGGLDLDHLRECWDRLHRSALTAEQTRAVLEKALHRHRLSP